MRPLGGRRVVGPDGGDPPIGRRREAASAPASPVRVPLNFSNSPFSILRVSTLPTAK